MENQSANTKRIAKNTVILYLRMAFSMIVALYTNRVILNALGIQDYGIYGVVGGVVIFFNVISGSLNAAISRFITFEIGKGSVERLNKVFCTSVNIQIFISIIFILVSELIGVWFLNTHMNIPTGRMYAANWVLQCSIFVFVVDLLSVPYNAAIIAHEHMGAFAYLSILSTVLNLVIAIIIVFVPFDKLIFYAFCILGVNVLMRVVYGLYCKKHFAETKWRPVYERSLLKEMTSFAGWNFLGASSGVLLGQGVNILMNLFFGVTVNAARNIASNVENAVNMFVNNFTVALNPQITKSYAAENMEYMHELVCKGAKYSFFILYIAALPILVETHFILILWLKQIPEYATIFTRLAIYVSLVSVLSQTLVTSMLATGRIKTYQIIISSLSYSIFIFPYICFKMGFAPYISYIIQLIIFIIQLVVRIVLLNRMIFLSIKMFIRDVLLRVITIVCVSLVLPIVTLSLMDESLMRFFIITLVSLFSSILSIYFIGLAPDERAFVKSKFFSLIRTNRFINY